jgi:hypothetical protein
MRSYRLISEESAEEQTFVSPIVSFAHDDANVEGVCVEEKKLRAGARRNLYLKGAND